MSPEEIGKYRAIAQQHSIDALLAAEERYSKAKRHDAAETTRRATPSKDKLEDEAVGNTEGRWEEGKVAEPNLELRSSMKEHISTWKADETKGSACVEEASPPKDENVGGMMRGLSSKGEEE